VIELQHLDLRGSDESLQTNPNLLTSHHPIVSEEPTEGRRLEGRPQARPCRRPSFETPAFGRSSG
jgi:hypothetical protein